MKFNSGTKFKASYRSNFRKNNSSAKIVSVPDYTPKSYGFKEKRMDAEALIKKLHRQYPRLFFYIVPEEIIENEEQKKVFRIYYRPKLKGG